MEIKKQNKTGISLIVLVITIIVMIILAGAIIISLNNSGIIQKANEAVNKTNEKQMQSAALTIWTDAYLDGKRGTELVETVMAELLKVDKDYAQKYNVLVTDKNVKVEAITYNHETIFDGDTIQGEPQILISENNVFDADATYRMTINSNGNTISFVAKGYPVDVEEVTMYVFASIKGNEVTTFTTQEQVNALLENLPEGTGVVGGGFFEGAGSVLSIEGMECNHVKVEIYEQSKIIPDLDGVKIFEGENIESLIGVKVNENQKYLLIVGESYYYMEYNSPGQFMVKDIYTNQIVGGLNAYNNVIRNGTVLVLKGKIELYDIGKNYDVIIDDDFIIAYRDSKWTYMFGGSVVPKEVAGKRIKAAVVIGRGEIYYDGSFVPVELKDLVLGETDYYIKIAATANPNDIFDLIINSKQAVVSGTLDLTEFSDIDIPERVRIVSTKIYVTEAVKQKYPDDNHVIVKTDE